MNLTEKVAWAIKTVKTEERLDKGISNLDLAKKLGTNKDTLADYIKGKGLLKGEVIENLVSIYNFNPTWLFKNRGEPFPGAREKYPEVCGPADESPFIIETTAEGETSTEFGDYVFVPRMNDKISAGPGTTPYNMSDLRIAFRKDWIRRKGDPKNMSLIKVIGDSMEPTLLAGDLVLIDHNRNRIDAQGGIYAIAIDHEIMIKRIQPLYHLNKIKIISDNKNYDPIEINIDDVNINGKVIWFAREIER